MPTSLLDSELLALRHMHDACSSDVSASVSFHGDIPMILDPQEMADLLYYSWNLFNSVPYECEFITVGSQQVEKQLLFKYLSHYGITQVFFVYDVLVHMSLAEIPSLANFLTAFVQYLIGKVQLEPADATCLSNILLLTWWHLGLATPNYYCHLSRALYENFVRLVTDTELGCLLKAISQYPEHANVLVVTLLRLYSDVFNDQLVEHDANGGRSSKLSEDPASRMLGVHASADFRQLLRVYEETMRLLDPPVPTIRIAYTKTLYDSVIRVLKQAVRHPSIVDSLRQRPELPFGESEVKHVLAMRFARIRDYLLVRACRCLARHSASPPENDPLPSQLSCLIHAAAPKHLVAHLLTSSMSISSAISSNSSVWDVDNPSMDIGSFEPHLELLCRTLDRGTNVHVLASWFVCFSDPKDVHLANSLLSRLVKYAPLLTTDVQFAFQLIVRIERVRQAALPEQNYLKLLRALLSQLSIDAKLNLLQLINSGANPAHATPLSRNPNQLESRMRLLFNRLVVNDESDINQSFVEDSQTNQTISSKLTPSSCNPEILMDCELLLLTCPILFLTELIRLPITRRCPASRLAVHQLLKQFSYCLSVTVADVCRSDEGKQPCRSIFQSLLLHDVLRSLNAPTRCSSSVQTSLIGDVNWDVVDEVLWTCEDTPMTCAIIDGQVIPPSSPTSHGENDVPVSPVVLTDPIVSTVVHLFELAPSEIATLLLYLNQWLPASENATNKLTIRVERVIHVLFCALVQWSHSTPGRESLAVLEQVVRLFHLLVVNNRANKRFSDHLDTSSLIATVIKRLFNRVGCPPSVGSDLMNAVLMVDEALHPNGSVSFDDLSTWMLWSEVRPTIRASEPVQPLQLEDTIVEHHLKLLLNWVSVCQAFNLPLADPCTDSVESPPIPDTISPRALCALLRLASVSDYSCESVFLAAEAMINQDARGWDPNRLPLQNILVGLNMFLRLVSVADRPVLWRRGFRCLDRLVNASILWIPYRSLVDKQCSGTGGHLNSIYLVNWTALRGSLDLLSLFTDMIGLQPLWEDSQSNSSMLRFVCNTLLMISTRTIHRVTSVPDARFQSIARVQVQRCVSQLSERLEVLVRSVQTTCILTAPAQMDLERLRMALDAAIVRLNSSQH